MGPKTLFDIDTMQEMTTEICGATTTPYVFVDGNYPMGENYLDLSGRTKIRETTFDEFLIKRYGVKPRGRSRRCLR